MPAGRLFDGAAWRIHINGSFGLIVRSRVLLRRSRMGTARFSTNALNSVLMAAGLLSKTIISGRLKVTSVDKVVPKDADY